jgi:carbon monoxide dehydrogenase subunit G
MASVRKEIHIDAAPDDVWDALRDWGELHHRLVPGFVTDAHLDGPDRVVTFFNGATVTERFVDRDHDARRLVWSVADGSFTHHNASAQVFAEGAGTRFVWIADVLPHELGSYVGELMEHGMGVIKQTLEASCGVGGASASSA